MDNKVFFQNMAIENSLVKNAKMQGKSTFTNFYNKELSPKNTDITIKSLEDFNLFLQKLRK